MNNEAIYSLIFKKHKVMKTKKAQNERSTFFRCGEFLPELMNPGNIEVVPTVSELRTAELEQYRRAKGPIIDGQILERDGGETDAVTAFSGGKLLGYINYERIGLGSNSRIGISYMNSVQKHHPVSWHLVIGLLKVAQSEGIGRIETGMLSSTGGHRIAERFDKTFGTSISSTKSLDVGESLSLFEKKGAFLENVRVRGLDKS